MSPPPLDSISFQKNSSISIPPPQQSQLIFSIMNNSSSFFIIEYLNVEVLKFDICHNLLNL